MNNGYECSEQAVVSAELTEDDGHKMLITFSRTLHKVVHDCGQGKIQMVRCLFVVVVFFISEPL